MLLKEAVSRRGADIYKGVNYNKEPFCFSSCVENICSVMQAAVGLKTHCRAADKRPGSSCIHNVSQHIHLSHLLGTELSAGSSCKCDFFFPVPFQRPPSLPLPQCFTLHIIQCAQQTTSVFVLLMFGGRRELI